MAQSSETLAGKTVMVTGASSGIGEALAREFAAKGYNVILAARRAEKLQKIVAEITSTGGSAIAVSMDVTSKSDVERGFKEAEEKFGPIHFTVANAGGGPETDKDLLTEEGIQVIQEHMEVNYFGAIYTVQQGILSARKCKGGAIIVISSPAASNQSGSVPTNPFWIGYSSSKAAVDAFVRVSAPGYLKENIRIYAVSPIVFDSELSRRAANHMNVDLEQFSLRKPLFPGIPGNARDLAPVMLSIFDNTTLYKPGDVIVCENQVTFSGHENYRQTYSGVPRFISRDLAKDFQGKPYVWNQ